VATSRGKAIVTDGLWRKSLSAIRSLGKAGFEVAVLGESVFTTGFWSRFTRHRIRGPLASRDPNGFGDTLRLALERLPGSVLLPMEDPSLEWVIENHEAIGRQARALVPPADAYEIAQDKGKTIALAEELGLPVPKTLRPETPEALSRMIAQAREPFVLKPRRGTGSAGVVYGSVGGQSAGNWSQHGPLLLQERIPALGRGLGVSLLMDSEGRCVARFSHERLKQYPNSGGPSTDRRSIHAPELEEWSLALLKRLGWRGIAMVEWKEDLRDGKPKLMEINPRFWGSLELAVRSGVDFPALYARAALGERLGPPPPYPAGVRCRWLIPGDILRYLTEPRSSRESLLAFFRGLPGLAEEWDTQDLRGALATVVCSGALALNPRYWRYVRRG